MITKKKPKKNKRVLVGMSGGVDSSVTAYLLLKKGYQVEGLSINTCQHDHSSAEKVCKALNIPLHILDREKLFTETVIQYFLETYKEGKTPNPCVVCNRVVKFQSLIDKANDLGIQYVATGHYAKIKYSKKMKRYTIQKGTDKKKDQSYVLYNLTQEQLSRTLLPLGKKKKEEVRKISENISADLNKEKESQDICFIPEGDYKEFLDSNIGKSEKGNILNINGEIIGEHQGITSYTVGQREGIGISAKKPLYVLEIRPDSNEIVVGEKENLLKTTLVATDINLVSIPEITGEMEVKAKIRYGAEAQNTTISKYDTDSVLVKFEESQRAITPGQSIVFYKRDLLLGGGIISEVKDK